MVTWLKSSPVLGSPCTKNIIYFNIHYGPINKDQYIVSDGLMISLHIGHVKDLPQGLITAVIHLH